MNKNMKPFNLEAAKVGKPICDRMGNNVRIICYDRKDSENYSIVALHFKDEKDDELILTHTEDGRMTKAGCSPYDLFMRLQKKEGWINIYKEDDGECKSGVVIYSSKERAIKNHNDASGYIGTVKIEWEDYA